MTAPMDTLQKAPDAKPRLTLSSKIRSLAGKAIYRYDMITPGDRIAVGLSGGKDSLLLLHLLKYIKIGSPVKYDLRAISVDMTDGEWDTRPIQQICDSLEVPLTVVPYAIERIIDTKNTDSPCSLCANLRRGLLNTAARRLGCNKIALGHNLDDVVETALMNLMHNGHFRSFQPKLWHNRAETWLIRPMIYMSEHQIANELKRLGVETSQHCCKYGTDTERSRTKSLIAELKPRFPDIKRNILHAMENHLPTDHWTATPRHYSGVYTPCETPPDAASSAKPEREQ